MNVTPFSPRTALLALILLAGPAAAAQSAVPQGWPPELAPAFERYALADYAETQRLCRAIRAGGNARLRDEADALAALASLRGDGRGERVEGRAALLEISQRRPGLDQRPECLLALGIAARELNETALALLTLQGALDRFAARGDAAPLAETAVALAETWLRHNEWERMDPSLQVLTPSSAAAAQAVRARRIAELSERLAALPPGYGDARIQVETALARCELSAPPSAPQGRARLERCAAAQPLTPAVAKAGLLLADVLEAAGEAQAGVAALQRVRDAALGELSQSADARIAAITKAQIEIDAPETVAPDVPLELRLRSRNIARLRLEVRRVDLPAWLEARRGIALDAQLPAAGATIATAEITITTARPHDWFDSQSAPTELPRITPPSGAYAIIASGTGADGAPLVVRKLLLASSLHAAAIVGGRRALVWAPRADGAAQARFWIHGAFVPLRLTLPGGLADFDLPGEARILRERRWTCLVQSGDEFALLRGALPPREAAARVVLAGGPAGVAIGETCTLLGIVDQRGSVAPATEVTIDWLDSSDRVVASQTAPLDRSGAFATAFTPAPELAGQSLRAQARLGTRMLDSLEGRFSLRVLSADQSAAAVSLVAGARALPGDARLLDLAVQAEYPWQVPLAGAYHSLDISAVPLPLDLAAGPRPRLTGRSGNLSDLGRATYNPPLEEFGLAARPLALHVRAVVLGWDKRPLETSLDALVGAAAHVWATPLEPPQLGRATRFNVHWLDALALARDLPSLEVRPLGGAWRALHLGPATLGRRSAAWFPQNSGPHELRAALAIPGAAPAELLTSFDVGGAAAARGRSVEIVSADADAADAGRLIVALRGLHPGPLLAWLDDDDPLSVASAPALAGDSRIALAARAGARSIRIAELLDGGLHLLAEAPITPPPRATPIVQLAALDFDADESRVRGVIEIEPSRVTSAWIRVTPALEPSGMDWSGEPPSDPRPAQPRIVAAGAPANPPPAAAIPDDVDTALRAGQTLWAGALPIAGQEGRQVSFASAPLPKLRHYHVSLITVDDQRGLTSRTTALSPPESPALTLDLPREMSLGDRLSAALTITGRPGATLKWEFSAGSHLTAGGTTSGEAVMPAEGVQRLLFAVEASATGAGFASARVEADGRTVTRRSDIHVRPAAAPHTTGDVRMQRAIYRLQATSDAAGMLLPEGDWERIRINDGDAVTVGDTLVIEYRISALRPLGPLRWTQALPAACVTFGFELRNLRLPGELRKTLPQSLEYDGLRLGQGVSIVEIPMVAVAPGVCAVPHPELSGAADLGLAIEPSDLRLTVRAAR